MPEELKKELDEQLTKIRQDRKPTNRGIMLLTSFLGSVMLQGSDLVKEDQDSLELLFWITHNGDGTPITHECRSK